VAIKYVSSTGKGGCYVATWGNGATAKAAQSSSTRRVISYTHLSVLPELLLHPCLILFLLFQLAFVRRPINSPWMLWTTPRHCYFCCYCWYKMG